MSAAPSAGEPPPGPITSAPEQISSPEPPEQPVSDRPVSNQPVSGGPISNGPDSDGPVSELPVSELPVSDHADSAESSKDPQKIPDEDPEPTHTPDSPQNPPDP